MSTTESTNTPIHAERWREDTNRYEFDFQRCHFKNGWAQLDSKQDASYFGQWANPLELRIFSYVEGDCCLMTASSPEEFAAEIRRMAKWSRDSGWGFAIDGMCSHRIIDAFTQLGLADLLH